MVFFKALKLFLGLKRDEIYNWILDMLYFDKVELITFFTIFFLVILLAGLILQQLWALIIVAIISIGGIIFGTYLGLKKTFFWLRSNWREAWTLARVKSYRQK